MQRIYKTSLKRRQRYKVEASQGPHGLRMQIRLEFWNSAYVYDVYDVYVYVYVYLISMFKPFGTLDVYWDLPKHYNC